MSYTDNDLNLARWLGISPEFVRTLPAEKRAAFERMRRVEIEISAWRTGAGPRPRGVLMDFPRPKRRPRRCTAST